MRDPVAIDGVSGKNDVVCASGEIKKGVIGPSAPGIESSGGSMMVLLNQGWRNIASIDMRRAGSSCKMLLIRLLASVQGKASSPSASCKGRK